MWSSGKNESLTEGNFSQSQIFLINKNSNKKEEQQTKQQKEGYFYKTCFISDGRQTQLSTEKDKNLC